MRAVIQLVSQASIQIDGKLFSSINEGIVALIGFEKKDSILNGEKLINRILNFRIFSDENGKMNKSLVNIDASLLLVPQFTLVAETHKGTRPGFSIGMPPKEGNALFQELCRYAKATHSKTEFGQFGAAMSVTLSNEGPVTFIIEN